METASCTLPIPGEESETFDRPKALNDFDRVSFPDVSPAPWPPRADEPLIKPEEERTPSREATEFEGLTGRSPGLRRVLEQVRQVAVTDSTVLLLGET